MENGRMVVHDDKDKMNRLICISTDEHKEQPLVTDEEINKLSLIGGKENRLFFYIYNNKESKINVVKPEDLVTHIEYNRALRPGRIMYMEDSENVFIRLNDGMLKKDKLEEYDQLAKEWFETKGKQISRAKDTRPYC